MRKAEEMPCMHLAVDYQAVWFIDKRREDGAATYLPRIVHVLEHIVDLFLQ